ncbi:MAG: hypothetical protein L6W00_16270 [Lentisphaeria bacterium]|nr:MAG: hypothetical protein L6W00_16270 [Lentisphaeria bacterium]
MSRRVVSRYSNDLRYWEVWNEQNIDGFWRDKADGENYTRLLRRTCEEIKKINPNLLILYGGTAGVPLDFIEKSFVAGAGQYFDIMNIHPYHWQGTPEWMIPQLQDLKAMMKKYRLQKPIWITEVGWSTALPNKFYLNVLPAAFEKAGIDPAQSTLGVIHAPEENFPLLQEANIRYNFSYFKEIKRFSFRQLRNLNPKQCQVLIPAIGETFPRPLHSGAGAICQAGRNSGAAIQTAVLLRPAAGWYPEKTGECKISSRLSHRLGRLVDEKRSSPSRDLPAAGPGFHR